MTAHKSTHSDAIYKCHCGSEFRCEQYLKNHQRRKHLEAAPSQAESEPGVKRLRLISPKVDVKVEDNVSALDGLSDSLLFNEQSFDPMQLLKLQMFGEE